MRHRLAPVASLACAATVLMVAAGAANAASWTKRVHSYPGFAIPRVSITTQEDGVAPGFVFLSPRSKYPQRTGPLILDSQGRVVWFHRISADRQAVGLQPQVLDGKPVLTWGQRPPIRNPGDQYYSPPHTLYNVIADDHYRILERIRARGHGMRTDLHDFQITPRGTALVLGYRHMRADLSKYGGPRQGKLIDDLVQEIDIETKRVLFSWSALRHIPLRESMKPALGAEWDPYHLNSVAEDSDGNLLVSSRHTSTVYKVDRDSGRIIWRLGGRDSDFKLGRGARFYYQHDAAREPDGTITMYDNRATEQDRSHGKASRAIKLRVDEKRMTATLEAAYEHPKGELGKSQGNAREIAGDHMFVGWGSSPWFSEHASDGRLLFAGRFPDEENQSYRAFKGPWAGVPGGAPAIVADQRGSRVLVYAAWNGATEVRGWRVLGGPSKDSLVPLGTGAWTDFETKLSFAGRPALVQVEALDATGAVIGRSAVEAPK